MRWLDDAEADAETMRTKRWGLKARDRKEWMIILREAKTILKGAVKPVEEKEEEKEEDTL
jgi:hypothetical protein